MLQEHVSYLSRGFKDSLTAHSQGGMLQARKHSLPLSWHPPPPHVQGGMLQARKQSSKPP